MIENQTKTALTPVEVEITPELTDAYIKQAHRLRAEHSQQMLAAFGTWVAKLWQDRVHTTPSGHLTGSNAS